MYISKFEKGLISRFKLSLSKSFLDWQAGSCYGCLYNLRAMLCQIFSLFIFKNHALVIYCRILMDYFFEILSNDNILWV